MCVVDPREPVAHFFAPDSHGQESQRRIIEAVISLVRFFFYTIIECEVSTEQFSPRIGRRVVRRYPTAFFQGFLSPVERVDDVVLITNMPRVFAYRTAQ